MVKPKKFETTIKIQVAGVARTDKDNAGILYAEVEYNIKDMEQQIDKCLLPFLEKVVGFKHAVVKSRLVPTGGVLVGFRSTLFADSPFYRKVLEGKKVKFGGKEK